MAKEFTELRRGKFTAKGRPKFQKDRSRIRSGNRLRPKTFDTRRGDGVIYAFALAAPADGVVKLKSAIDSDIRQITQLGDDRPLQFATQNSSLLVKLSEGQQFEHAIGLKISLR